MITECYRVEEQSDMINKFHQSEKLAGIYYAYDVLHRYLQEPFTSYMPEALFNIARFVTTEITHTQPKGVSSLYPFSNIHFKRSMLLIFSGIIFLFYLRNVTTIRQNC